MAEPEDAYPVTPLTVFAIRWWGVIAVVYGALICLGGPDRWSSRSYMALNQAPGSPYGWGAVAIASGALIVAGSLTGRRTVRNVGFWVFAAWCAVLGAGFIIAAIHDDHVSLGIAVMFVAAAGHALSLTRTDERSRLA